MTDLKLVVDKSQRVLELLKVSHEGAPEYLIVYQEKVLAKCDDKELAGYVMDAIAYKMSFAPIEKDLKKWAKE
jgi:hypothetical protein